MSNKNNDEKFVMNFFQKGNNNKQIVNVQNVTQNFSESDYIPEEDGRFCNDEMPEELTEIEKELNKDKKRLISEKIGKKLTEKGYSSKKVGPFTFYIKTREEYTAALRQTLEFAENMAEASVRNRNENTELMQFFSMTILYLSDLLEKVEVEDEKDKEQKND